MENQAQYSLILTTFPDQKTGQQFAKLLIERHLAACVNVLPDMVSVYQWQGNVEQSPECQLLIKTEAAKFQEVSQVILDNHPYELPEILEVRINGGLPAFLSWISGEVKS